MYETTLPGNEFASFATQAWSNTQGSSSMGVHRLFPD